MEKLKNIRNNKSSMVKANKTVSIEAEVLLAAEKVNLFKKNFSGWVQQKIIEDMKKRVEMDIKVCTDCKSKLNKDYTCPKCDMAKLQAKQELAQK